MTGQRMVSGDDLQELTYPWAWWQGRQLEGEALAFALEMQALDSDVVAVLDALVEAIDGRVQVQLTVAFGPASAGNDRDWLARFQRDEANPRFRRLLAGKTQADGFQHLGPGHWQLHVIQHCDDL